MILTSPTRREACSPLTKIENPMGKIVKASDLTVTEADPGEQAVFEPVLEQCDVGLKLPTWLGGGEVNITTHTRAGAMVMGSITTLLLTFSGCLVAGIALAANSPDWLVLSAALIAPPVYFILAYALFRRPAQGRANEIS